MLSFSLKNLKFSLSFCKGGESWVESFIELLVALPLCNSWWILRLGWWLSLYIKSYPSSKWKFATKLKQFTSGPLTHAPVGIRANPGWCSWVYITFPGFGFILAKFSFTLVMKIGANLRIFLVWAPQKHTWPNTLPNSQTPLTTLPFPQNTSFNPQRTPTKKPNTNPHQNPPQNHVFTKPCNKAEKWHGHPVPLSMTVPPLFSSRTLARPPRATLHGRATPSPAGSCTVPP